MASIYDLVSLSDYKNYMSLSQTTDDLRIQTLITSVSRAILTRLNRGNLLPTPYLEVRNGMGQSAFFLDNWPVTSISSLTINGHLISPIRTDTDISWCGSGYILDEFDEQPPGKPQMVTLRGVRCHHGIGNIQIAYTAGYQVNEAVNLSSAAACAVTVEQPYGAWAKDILVVDTNSRVFTAVTSNPQSGQYTVDQGNYLFSTADIGTQLLITYAYIPADIALVAMDWIADRQAYLNRIGYSSKSLGGQETVSYLVKAIPDFVDGILRQYMKVM